MGIFFVYEFIILGKSFSVEIKSSKNYFLQNLITLMCMDNFNTHLMRIDKFFFRQSGILILTYNKKV